MILVSLEIAILMVAPEVFWKSQLSPTSRHNSASYIRFIAVLRVCNDTIALIPLEEVVSFHPELSTGFVALIRYSTIIIVWP